MTFTKEQLQHIIETDHVQCGDASALARMALAGMEAEPVAWAHRLINKRNGVVHPWVYGSAEACPSEGDIFNIEVMPLYTAPPAPVSVPDEATPDNIDILASTYAPRGVTFQWDRDECNAAADSWNACRAAMLQGAEQQNRQQNIPENIPATQFKPVADLYGLTSPTGSETSFTFDAVEARDFIDGGWSCQEYVELERFQEAITNHTEDKLAMVDHSGDSNNMVEPVTTACKLPDDFDFDRFNDVVWLEAVASNPHMHSPTTSTIAMVALELNRKLADGNSPVIPDGWVMVPVEPTEDMIVYGFESEPDEDFSDPAAWEEYQAMSGCRQAAHRAKLCWAAMIAAAPKLEVE
ncbi:hypothetical protein [Enterobacter asburiae]